MRIRLITITLAAFLSLDSLSSGAIRTQAPGDSSQVVASSTKRKKKATKQGTLYVGKRGGLYRFSKSGKKVYDRPHKKPVLKKKAKKHAKKQAASSTTN